MHIVSCIAGYWQSCIRVHVWRIMHNTLKHYVLPICETSDLLFKFWCNYPFSWHLISFLKCWGGGELSLDLGWLLSLLNRGPFKKVFVTFHLALYSNDLIFIHYFFVFICSCRADWSGDAGKSQPWQREDSACSRTSKLTTLNLSLKKLIIYINTNGKGRNYQYFFFAKLQKCLYIYLHFIYNLKSKKTFLSLNKILWKGYHAMAD